MTIEKDPEQKEQQEKPATPEGDNIFIRLEEALRENDQFRNLAQRTQADFINYKRRVEGERQELQRFANSALLLKIAGIVDDFQRAISSLPREQVPPQWLEGVQLIMHKLEALLESEGISKIQATGLDFNPEEHEALLYEETSDDQGGKVISVLREGYKFHGRVLRPAQVSVGKAKGGVQDSKTSDNSEKEK